MKYPPLANPSKKERKPSKYSNSKSKRPTKKHRNTRTEGQTDTHTYTHTLPAGKKCKCVIDENVKYIYIS